MDKFWSLLEESVIFQGILVLMFGAAYTYMLVTSQPIPADFSQLMGVIVGFFFGGKAAVTSRKTAQATLEGQVALASAQADLARSVRPPDKDC